MTDLITVSLTAGKGGRGHVSFRRTKQVTKGGPDGGYGGNGGDVVIEAREDVRDLVELKGRPKIVAGAGGEGGKSGLAGKRGENLRIKVPVGTIVRRDNAEGRIEADLEVDGDAVIVLGGGVGGRGNITFAGPRNRTPILAEAGELGETALVEIEVRVKADMAIIGQTQAGKSSLLNLLTNAGVEEREYSYSTAEPVIGSVTIRGKEKKVIEIPGLFRAGEEKTGLGSKFLRHADRANFLVLMISEENDLSNEAERLDAIFSESWPALLEKPRIYVRAKRKNHRFDVYAKDKSSLHQNMPAEELKVLLLSELSKTENRDRTKAKNYDMGRLKNRDRLQNEDPIVEKSGTQYVLKSTLAEMLAHGTDMNTWEAQSQFRGQLKDWKLARLIERQGIKEGDELRVGKKVVKW
ncbi:MAG: DUF1967 domain-containing protein [Dehalococcoidia bacterium]|nr:DUF1967 domain-containing protein [Dehalococcoidia bacterium]